jgi:hypothetical protein
MACSPSLYLLRMFPGFLTASFLSLPNSLIGVLSWLAPALCRGCFSSGGRAYPPRPGYTRRRLV